jgi:glycosyltransferase involved in cell wall biosynthesis
MRDLSSLKVSFLAGTLAQGGAERQLFYIVKALRESGAELQVLSLTRNDFWEDRIERLGVPVIWVGQNRSHLKRLSRIITAVRKNRPAILQSQHFFCNAYVAAAARLLRVHDIGAMRSDGRNEVRDCGPLRGWLNLHAPRVLAANCRPAIGYARSRGIAPYRLHFLPNAVDTDQLGSRNDSLSGCSGKKDLRLILTGRLATEKRVERFLNVLARLRDEPGIAEQNVTALVVGDGPLKGKLEEYARGLGLWPHAVEFCGPVADMAPLYHQAAVCVLTSDYEGTPNVLLEAMAAGLPVVATNVGGVSDIVQHGETGFLCDPADTDGMVKALVRLIQDADLRAKMGSAAQRFVTANHAFALLPRFLQQLYEKRLMADRFDERVSANAAIDFASVR